MPLYDQDGVQTDERRVAVSADVREIVVRHSEVHLLSGDGDVLVLVDRPTHPGAGLGVEIADVACPVAAMVNREEET